MILIGAGFILCFSLWVAKEWLDYKVVCRAEELSVPRSPLITANDNNICKRHAWEVLYMRSRDVFPSLVPIEEVTQVCTKCGELRKRIV